MRGKTVVLLMSSAVLCYAGLIAYLTISGHAHPLFVTWSYTTQLMTQGLFTAIVLLCLYRLYWGSPSIRHLVGVCGALASVGFAVLVTLGTMEETLSLLWIGFDSLGLAVSGFATWVCIFSVSAARFFSYQNYKY